MTRISDENGIWWLPENLKARQSLQTPKSIRPSFSVDLGCSALSEQQRAIRNRLEQRTLRLKWKRYWKRENVYHDLAFDVRAWASTEVELHGCELLRCGAKNRFGEPCERFQLHPNGRCKFHGGKSTGPKTPEGMKKVTLNLPNPMEGDLDQP